MESFDICNGVVVGQEMGAGRDVFQCGVAVDFQGSVPVAAGGDFVEFCADFYRIWRCVEVGNEVEDLVGVMKDDDGHDAT